MTEGTQHTDGQFLVGDNGQAANEQVITRMSKDTKAQIEEEFQTLGVSNWQELMANLINKRHQLNGRLPRMKPIAQKEEATSNINWWKIGLVGIFIAIGGLTILLKKGNSVPKISFR